MADLGISRERWLRLQPILDHALELDDDEVATYLDRACAGDDDLRAEIERLLAADRATESPLDSDVAELAAALVDEIDRDEIDRDGGLGQDAGIDALAETRTRDTRPVAGWMLGPYRVIRTLGRGGMGVVYEAEDTRLGRRVAIKLLPPEYGRSGAARERFLREARAASALDHPNICTIHDIGETDGEAGGGRLYMVMAHYRGETLKERIERGPLPVPEARKIAAAVARGLERAHAAGIIHRDVKPANVMLTDDGEVKILDFGIAKVEGDAALTRTGGTLGTPYCMSPEQVRAEPVDARTDLWSLGVVLYEMVTGERPFRGETPMAIAHSILHARPVPLGELVRDVPEWLEHVVARLLAKDPDERYADAAELLADLESGTATTTRVLTGAATGDAAAAGTAWRRRRWTIAAAALAALVALAFVLSTRLRPPRPPLYVAVMTPELAGGGGLDEAPLLAAGVGAALLRGLAGLEGVAALATDQLEAEPDSPAAAARALAAAEVLRARLDCGRTRCQVTLSRIAGEDGRTLAVESFEVPGDDLRLVASATRSHLRTLYPALRPRDGDASDVALSHEQYAEFLRLRERVRSMESIEDRELLERLAALRRAVPDFPEIYLLEARAARLGYFASRDVALLEHAFEVLERARRLAPRDPRIFSATFDLAVGAERWQLAEEALAELERLDPGHVDVVMARSEDLARRGDRAGALAEMRRAARLHPDFRTLWRLALREYEQGEVDAARATLATLLERNPSSVRARSFLAQIELLVGSPRRTVELLDELVREAPGVIELSNLGTAHMLLGQYPQAADSYRRAYELQPGHLFTVLNLADATLLMGQEDAAAELYRRVVEMAAATSNPGWQDRTVAAQALAHLERSREAVAEIQSALQEAPDNSQAAFEAALVYTLVGERASALVNAERALELGFAPHWFELAWFDELRADPRFRERLGSAGAPGAER